jgi:hypothetical protein
MAAGFSSIDTQRFNWMLGQRFARDFQLFKVLSPKDMYWEIIGADRYIHGEFGDLVFLSRHHFRSVYLNGLHWQHGVQRLLDRMDHYLVYVSSVTESVLWELSQLDTDDRRGRVTVVFDEEAIKNKELQLSLRDRMKDLYGDKLLWSKPGLPRAQTIDELRGQLSRKFLVTTRDEFEQGVEKHRGRILESSSTLPPGTRENWLDFRFHPAMDDSKLGQLREMSAWVEARIEDWTGDRGIDCLPLFLNLVQLRIFMTLLLGEHHDTGRALAGYAAIMEAARDYFVRAAKASGQESGEGDNHLAMLEAHRERAQCIGWCLIAHGKSHEFGDFTSGAQVEYNAVLALTKSAV